MEAWIIWTIIAILLVVAEIFTSGFAVICLSVGALVAAATGYFGGGVALQLIVFAIVGVLMLLFVRPFLLSSFSSKTAESVKTNLDALLGRRARVLERVDAAGGRVSLDGDVWRAQSQNGETFDEGESVEVLALESTILIVKNIK